MLDIQHRNIFILIHLHPIYHLPGRCIPSSPPHSTIYHLPCRCIPSSHHTTLSTTYPAGAFLPPHHTTANVPPTRQVHSSHALWELVKTSPFLYCSPACSHMVHDGQQLPGRLAGWEHVTGGHDIIAMHRIWPICHRKHTVIIILSTSCEYYTVMLKTKEQICIKTLKRCTNLNFNGKSKKIKQNLHYFSVWCCFLWNIISVFPITFVE